MARFSMYSGEQIETQDNDFDTRVPGVVHRQNQNREDMPLLRTSRENVLRQEQNGNEENGSKFLGGRSKLGQSLPSVGTKKK